MVKDLYKVLGVAESADDDTLKKAYRKLAKELHPDATGGDKKKTERFKEVADAYGVLGDAKKRAEYDRMRHAPVGADGMPQGFDPESFAQTFGGGRFRGGVHVGEGADLNDIFASIFGGGFQGAGGAPAGFATRTRARVPRGADMAGTLELTFAEAALGARRTVRTGSGATVEVAVPGGAESGARLRIPGQGARPPGRGGQPGDLYLELQVRPDPHLRREGDDVVLDLPVTPSEAALGAKIEVPTVEGPVTVSVPPGTSSGARLRLRGRGIKTGNGDARSDQFCRIEIAVPKDAAADPEVRRLYEELARLAPGKGIRRF